MYNIDDLLVAMYIGKNPGCYKKQILKAFSRNHRNGNVVYVAIKSLIDRDCIRVVKTEFINNRLRTQSFYALTDFGVKTLNKVMNLMKDLYTFDELKRVNYEADKRGENLEPDIQWTTHTYPSGELEMENEE